MTDEGCAVALVAKRGGHFTLMVVGESGLGKTTLMSVHLSSP